MMLTCRDVTRQNKMETINGNGLQWLLDVKLIPDRPVSNPTV